MRVIVTKPFEKDYADLPADIRQLTDKKLAIFLENPRYPSLRVKKMEDSRNIWEASITKSYRFTFQIKDDLFILRRIGTHDILRNP